MRRAALALLIAAGCGKDEPAGRVTVHGKILDAYRVGDRWRAASFAIDLPRGYAVRPSLAHTEIFARGLDDPSFQISVEDEPADTTDGASLYVSMPIGQAYDAGRDQYLVCHARWSKAKRSEDELASARSVCGSLRAE